MTTAEAPSRTEEARRIWHVLASRRGEERAVTASEIARRTGVGDSAGTGVRAVIAEALEFFPHPVAASSKGYFIPVRPEEFRHYDATLCSRLREVGRRLAVFRRKAEAAGYRREGSDYLPPPRRDTLFAP